MTKLSTVSALAIRRSTLGCNVLARLYGMSRSQIKRIRSGEQWKKLGTLDSRRPNVKC